MIKYYTKSLYALSILSGATTFLITLLMADFAVALLFGAVTALLTSITIPVVFAISDRKFIPLKKQIKDKILLEEKVAYLVGNEAKDGLIVTTANSMFVLSTDGNKPIKFEIKREAIKKISITEDIYLNIFLDYDKCIRVFSDNCDELLSKLTKEGFGKN